MRHHLQEKRRQHNTLLQRIPALTDLQLAWPGFSSCSAPPLAPTTSWASWQDSLPALLARLPTEAEQLLASLSSPHAGMPSALAAACSEAAAVRQPGSPRGSSAAPAPQLGEETFRGWQRAAASACDERAFETRLSQLDLAS